LAATAMHHDYIPTCSISLKKFLTAKTFLFLFQMWLYVKLFYIVAGVPWSRDTNFYDGCSKKA